MTFRLTMNSLVAGLCLLLVSVHVNSAEQAPAPKLATVADTALSLDQKVIDENKLHTQIGKNIQYLCDVIGPRVTGSPRLEKANRWAAEKMKEYGVENVKLEPWEIPMGWERGICNMKIVEPDNGKVLIAAAYAWTPGTKGKVTGEVVFFDVKTRADLAKYKGKLKDAIILREPPADVKPVTDMTYGAPPASTPTTQPAKKDEPKKVEPKEPKKDDKKDGCDDQPEPKKTTPEPKEQPQPKQPKGGNDLRKEISEFLKAEGAACVVIDSKKPHGLLVMTGRWPDGDRGAQSEPMPAVFMIHEHYRMLHRLATAKDGPKPRVEVEITNKFIPGPITVFNTVGEIKGAKKPDEFVVVGAHLDSWDLGSGATDNGTGSCVVLEVARIFAALAKQGIRPDRTIRFVLFTGEEQGLFGSKQYVKRHEAEMTKTSMALVHDTGTGKVVGINLMNREAVKAIFDKELVGLKKVDGFLGATLRASGGTDHLPFEAINVPGFACNQDIDEYRLTHHTQTDTFDHVKVPNLNQGAQVIAVTAMRVANLPDLLPRQRPEAKKPKTQ